MSKDQQPKSQPQQDVNNQEDAHQKNPRSGAFKETHPMQEKSTINEEDADLEQQRKEALTERD